MRRLSGSKIYEQLKGRRCRESISGACSCQVRWRGDSKAHAIYFYICFLSKEKRLWRKMILYGPQFGCDIDGFPLLLHRLEQARRTHARSVWSVVYWLVCNIAGSVYRSREDQSLKYFIWGEDWCERQSIISTSLTQMIHTTLFKIWMYV